MHKTKFLKLLGMSLIVGILGLTGFCIKLISNDNKDNNDLALVAGLVVAEQQAQQAEQQAQQAEQAAQQAAYEAANNTENPESFCAVVMKSGTYYTAKLIPLMEQDCYQGFEGSSLDEFKQKLLNIINNDADLNTNCPNTKNAISSYNPPPPLWWRTCANEKYPCKGKKLTIRSWFKHNDLYSCIS
jgi:hypothetical protein